MRRAPTLGDLILALLLLASLVAIMLAPGVAGAQARSRRGFAAHYRSGLMEQVARRRGLDAPAGSCLVASPFEAIGVRLAVRSARGSRVCLVVDVAHPRDRPTIMRRQIVIELDFRTNGQLCPPAERPERCPVTVERLATGRAD